MLAAGRFGCAQCSARDTPYLPPMDLPLSFPNLAGMVDTLLTWGLAITLALTGLRGAWAHLRKDFL